MIVREDILSMPFLKKTQFTGCHKGMRYRLEKDEYTVPAENEGEEDKKTERLKATIWPEPFNYIKTPDEKKTVEYFSFNEEGVVASIAWMNEMYAKDEELYKNAAENWDSYEME
ncbi:MAG: hypothetical protein J6033_06945 [Lachnospiraceae bacterium]|nr:hypothetical protein [Lachnospiraceae bacterium]